MRKDCLLSEREETIVTDTEWLYAKRRIIEKVYLLFGELSLQYGTLLKDALTFPEEVTAVTPKIYKGENYLYLPYVMLDHPRYFSGADACAVRTLFWWGNAFSIHLVLGGKYKRHYEERIQRYIQTHALQEWYISVTNDPWQHHFEPSNYQRIGRQTTIQASGTGSYLKLGRQHPLHEWRTADAFFSDTFVLLMKILSSS